MKATKLITAAITLAVAIIVCSCHHDKTYKIGVSQCSSDDWRNKMNDEIYREIMFHPEATVEIRSADDNNEKQIADIRYFADNGFDIIIAAPNEADAITPIIKEVYESGIPVMIFDRDINGDSYTARIGVDNTGIGRSAAQYTANLLGKGGRVMEIHGLAGSTPAIERSRGFREVAEQAGLSIVSSGYGNWNYEDAERVVDSLLAANSDINGIFAHNDRMAIAAAEVARRRGMDIRVVGIDAAPEIGIQAVADSVIDATFLYPTEGYRLIRTALAIVEGKDFVRNQMLPNSSAVDKSNADILLQQNGSLIEETSKIKLLKSQVDEYWDRHSAQTTLFYAAIAIVALLFILLFLMLRVFWQNKHHRLELMEQNRLLEQQRDTEKELNTRLQEATNSKMIFFTNVSHDLRTPLTLIAEPVEQLSDANNLTTEQKSLMRIANKNVKILRRLINQILDFRKYENGKLAVNKTEVQLTPLLTEWIDAFSNIALKRHIKLSVEINIASDFSLAIDSEKIERVFFNLLSNAFKYTPENGKIKVSCSAVGNELRLTVADTGKGISAEDLKSIFDRFYQVDHVHPNGSGIGLSLAKAFIELHNGSITAESEPGVGSTFTIVLPVVHCGHTDEEVKSKITAEDVTAELASIENETFVPEENRPDNDLPLLLVIDDNSDIRTMIHHLLSDSYRIIEASNGKDGVRMAARHTPDLIICDVMMPVMDGMECCRLIKEEISTSHIPVLMLTACSMDEQRIQGYESGADGYLSKPFNSEMLKKRCANLIENRKRINISSPLKLQDTAQERPADIDDEFYTRFMQLISKEMSNADLNIDTIAASLGMGRSQFYRKIKSLTNYSPVELLRKLRTEKARELLTTTRRSVSEIAYEVGFSSPAYFTRVYRETYGETPSELRTRLGG